MAEADGHSFMSRCRNRSIGAKQTVPPGQVKSEIAVGFTDDHRMMHPMHFRGNHEKTQHSVDRFRQTHIAVIEQTGSIEENLEKNHGQGGNPQNEHRCDLNAHGKKNFQGMESNPGRGVKIEIRMVHHVQAPKDGEGMKHGMLEVDDKIKKYYTDYYGQPKGQPALNQKTPAVGNI